MTSRTSSSSRGTLKFAVSFSGECDAGLLPFSDEITVEIASGEPGGEPGEFADFLCEALAEWYDGASVWEGTLADLAKDIPEEEVPHD